MFESLLWLISSTQPRPELCVQQTFNEWRVKLVSGKFQGRVKSSISRDTAAILFVLCALSLKDALSQCCRTGSRVLQTCDRQYRTSHLESRRVKERRQRLKPRQSRLFVKEAYVPANMWHDDMVSIHRTQWAMGGALVNQDYPWAVCLLIE